MTRILARALLLGLLVASLEAQSAWYVDPDASGVGNGSPAQPYLRIVDAVAAAGTGDTIYLLEGLHEGGDVDLGQKNLAIVGLSATQPVVIANPTTGATGVFRIGGPATGVTRLIDLVFESTTGAYDFHVEARDTGLELSGCTFRAGASLRAAPPGTGSVPPVLTIDHCDFADGYLVFPDAPPVGSSAIVSDCQFSGTTTGYNPHETVLRYDQLTLDGCQSQGPSSPITIAARAGLVRNCQFENQALVGLRSEATALTLRDCLFRRCWLGFQLRGPNHLLEGVVFEDCFIGLEARTYSAPAAGTRLAGCRFETTAWTPTWLPAQRTGMALAYGDVVIDRSRFLGLGRPGCRALELDASSLIRDCLFHADAGPMTTPAIDCHGGLIHLVGCSFVGDVASGVVAIQALPWATVALRNSILRGQGSWIGGAASVDHCDVEGGWSGAGGHNLDLDPLFVDPAAGDFRLAAGSPCLDAGDADASDLAPIDLDDQPRVAGLYVDLGAYERPAAAIQLGGSGDDLSLEVERNGERLGQESAPVTAGDLVRVLIRSPQHQVDGFPVWLLGQLHPDGQRPAAPVGHPSVHLDLALAESLYDPALAAGVGGWLLGLSPAGLDLSGSVPPGLVGQAYLIQAFALFPLAGNGWYAATQAYDLVHG
ncbi:MAG: hypothetical protein H6807_12645 [Planctomycetes bacterium]|nr:hypothetical protein [Planctomycetota bacterium]